MRISEKPPTFSKADFLTPMLKLRGWNLVTAVLLPRIPPVVKTEVME